MTGDDTLRERVLALAAETPSPTRIMGTRRMVALLVASVVLALLIFDWMGGIQHSNARPRNITFVIAGGWAIFSAALSWLVLSRRGSTIGLSPVLLSVATLLAPIALVGWLHVNDTYSVPIHKVGWRCLFINLSVSAPPLVSFLAMGRRMEPRAPWALGGAIGAVCGAWGGVVVDLWCPLAYASHVLVGHVVPLVLLIILGATLGQRMLGLQRISATRS